ncbi:MAG TPA: hypothetical protein VK030_01845 [Actinomycetales bacterium]|nr:hypothetical protein [Actinomycetales bacterium]
MLAHETPAPPRSFSAEPHDPQLDQLRAERRELAHWLRLIIAKRDLIAARVVPPLTELHIETAPVCTNGVSQIELANLLELDSPLPSSDDLLLLQRCAAETSRRIAQLDDQIQAW